MILRLEFYTDYKQALENIREKKVTAIYVLNNNLCMDVLKELKKQQLSIPEDLSLLVWDDEEINDYLDITTIAQPVEQIGKNAVRNLLKLKKKEKDAEKITENYETLKADIIFRKSCGTV